MNRERSARYVGYLVGSGTLTPRARARMSRRVYGLSALVSTACAVRQGPVCADSLHASGRASILSNRSCARTRGARFRQTRRIAWPRASISLDVCEPHGLGLITSRRGCASIANNMADTSVALSLVESDLSLEIKPSIKRQVRSGDLTARAQPRVPLGTRSLFPTSSFEIRRSTLAVLSLDPMNRVK